MTNVFTKPSGKLKGSQTIAAQGDKKGAGAAKSTSVNPKSKVMAKIMKQYPNKYGAPSAAKVVAANEAARNLGAPISQEKSKRNLKFVAK